MDGMSVVMMLLEHVIVTLAAVRSERTSAPKVVRSSGTPPRSSSRRGPSGPSFPLDLFFFYAFHELALIPTFLMIGMLGPR